MIENVMHNVGGVEMFGIVSICLFFGLFAGVLLWAARLKKPYLKSMCELPLDGDTLPPGARSSNSEIRHE